MYQTKFRKKQFDQFIKDVFHFADEITMLVEPYIESPFAFHESKWSELEECVYDMEPIEIEEKNLPGKKYPPKGTKLYLNKNYHLLQYFQAICKWDDFAEEDPTTGIRLDCVEFYRGKRRFAWITSHYNAYYNNYGWNENFDAEKGIVMRKIMYGKK